MDEDQTQPILQALREAGSRDPDLRTYYELHVALFHLQARASAEIAGTLDMEDAEALRGRVLQGRPMLSFGHLPIEAEKFTELVSNISGLLAAHAPESPQQSVPESPADCLALARERFMGGQAFNERPEGQGEADLVQVSVDLALMPYLEWAAKQVLPYVDQELWKRRYCPGCAGAPDFAYLEEETGARHLLCSRCNSQWRYQRLGCARCGTDDFAKQSYYPSKDGVYRLYLCQACHRYLKVIDLRKVSRRVLFPVERVTTVAMDLAAREEGYRSE